MVIAIIITFLISVILTLLVCFLIFKKWTKKTIPLTKDILKKIFMIAGSPKSEKDLLKVMYKLKKRD